MARQPTTPGTPLLDTYALATTHEFDDEVLVHRADCPKVHELAKQGHEVHSLFGCLEPIMPGMRQHECLEKFGPGPVLGQKDASKDGASGIKRFTLVKRLSPGQQDSDPSRDAGKTWSIEPLCEGAEFADGRVAVHWLKSNKLDVWPSLQDLYREIGESEYGGDVFWDDI